MLKFKGHVFLGDYGCACCVADARMISIDPTGTQGIRSAYNSALAIKWRGLRVLVRKMILDQDILSLGSRGLMAIANPAIQGGATRTQMFQRWFDYIMGQQVIGDGSFMRDYIRRGYDAGRTFAQGEVGIASTPLEGDRQETLLQLAVVELQGIAEAVSQRAVRAVATGLLTNKRPSSISRDVLAAIDAVGVPRSTALVELIVVKAFSEASLDVYASAGVRRVGLVPETLLATRDARRVTPTGRAGTRSRKGEGPSVRTIQRIKRHEREVERVAGSLVQVKTAGDKRVCQRCRSIARKGPYRINKARALIPAHPRCRCVFVPVFVPKPKPRDAVRFGDAVEARNGDWYVDRATAKAYLRVGDRWEEILDYDPNQERDEYGRWTAGGGSASPSAPSVLASDPSGNLKGNSAERVAMRKALKSETDPEKRRQLQEAILGSFQKQIAKKGGDPDLEAKLAKYSRMYRMTPPGATVSPPPVLGPGSLEIGGQEQTGKGGSIKQIRIVGVSANHEMAKKMQDAIDSIPAHHREKLANLGVVVERQDTLHYYPRGSSKKHQALGLYWSGGVRDRKVQIAEFGNTQGYKLRNRGVRNTTIHELGHAIDHANNWEPGHRVAITVDEEWRKLPHVDKVFSEYYVSNNREKFAELYNATYAKKGRAFGMTLERAQRMFPKSIALMKSLEAKL